MNTEYNKKCLVILTNEILPRARRLGISVSEFIEPSLSGALAKLELDGTITRRDVRMMLDQRVQVLQENVS